MEDGIAGLTTAEVLERVRGGLVNTAAHARSKTFAEIAVENTFSVFNIIIGAIVAFLVVFRFTTGDDRLLLDAVGVSAVALLNTLIAVYQEVRAARALDKVNLLLKREVTAIRDGVRVAIPPEAIVLDDILVLERGDQAVVDGTVAESRHLELNESLLTGESDPVLKDEGAAILSGSFCVSGMGLYRVEKIGTDSFAAQVMRQAKKYRFTVTPLQRKLDLLVKGLFATAVLLVILSVAVRGADGFSADFARRVATILVALVPQGLVLMSSVTFAIGVYRISRIGAIVQRLNAIESFSNVQVICLDKTGTLTRNTLAVRSVTPVRPDLTPDAARLVAGNFAWYSTDKNATARALESCGHEDGWRVTDEIPFSSERKMSFIALEHVDGDRHLLALGAFDLLVAHAGEDARAEALRMHATGGLEVYRTLLLGELRATASLDELRHPDADFTVIPLCICAITDEVRDDVADALKLFESKGIRLKILSGDSGPAIQSVCREIGWEVEAGGIVSGDDLDALTPEAFGTAVAEKKIFARLKPGHKREIIRELRRRRWYTAMIGDGVNDLPAIKEADLGIAMEEGSAITKEVADIVLLKNRFTLLPRIFDEGNRIVNTVAAAAKLFLVKNFMVIFLSLATILFLLEFPLTPRRISLINIFAIGLPALIIAVRNRNTAPTTHFMAELLSFVGVSSACIVGFSYLGFMAAGWAHIARNVADMVMVSIIIMVSIASFFAVIWGSPPKNRNAYLAYGIVLVCGYFLLAAVLPSVVPLTWVKSFYEIGDVNAVLSLLYGGIGSVALIALQRLRTRMMRRFLR